MQSIYITTYIGIVLIRIIFNRGIPTRVFPPANADRHGNHVSFHTYGHNDFEARYKPVAVLPTTRVSTEVVVTETLSSGGVCNVAEIAALGLDRIARFRHFAKRAHATREFAGICAKSRETCEREIPRNCVNESARVNRKDVRRRSAASCSSECARAQALVFARELRRKRFSPEEITGRAKLLSGKLKK